MPGYHERMTATDRRGTCFVIAPLGEQDSTHRRNIDGLLEIVIRPALAGLFDRVLAAHEIPSPGNITAQVISHLLNDEMVIADLSELNPNVMYELGVRHAGGKPAVIIADDSTRLPFDVAPERTLLFRRDLKGAEDLKPRLTSSVREALLETIHDNPVQRVADADVIRRTVTTTDVQHLLLNQLQAIQEELGRLRPPVLQAQEGVTNKRVKYRIEVRGEAKRTRDFYDAMATAESCLASKLTELENGILCELWFPGRVDKDIFPAAAEQHGVEIRFVRGPDWE